MLKFSQNYENFKFMNILLVGQWGREHALAEMYSKSKQVKKVFVIPGNGLMDFKNKKIVTVLNVNVHDKNQVLDFVKKNNIDFADISPEDFLAIGYVDLLKDAGVQVVGPTKLVAEIEWSKDWSRHFMEKYNLPIPTFKSFSSKKEGIKYINSLPKQILYIKASGLCGGKGAVRAKNKKEAISAIESMTDLGKAGETFLVEEAVVGEEFSLFALCDGKNYVITGNAQDHKAVYNADLGPNTGGMGSVAPTQIVTKKVISEVEEKILKPFLNGMAREGRAYQGILYVGGMLTKNGVKIIEFNARWGSPEAEVILPSIQTDYVTIAKAITKQQLKNLKIRFDKKIRVSICGAAAGYPSDYSKAKGKEIFGLVDAMKLPDITIFGANIKRVGQQFFVDGGRIFHVVAEGNDVLDARKKAYNAMSLISIEEDNLHYRTDIGLR